MRNDGVPKIQEQNSGPYRDSASEMQTCACPPHQLSANLEQSLNNDKQNKLVCIEGLAVCRPHYVFSVVYFA